MARTFEARAESDLKLSHAEGALFLPELPSDHPSLPRVTPPTFGVPEAY